MLRELLINGYYSETEWPIVPCNIDLIYRHLHLTLTDLSTEESTSFSRSSVLSLLASQLERLTHADPDPERTIGGFTDQNIATRLVIMTAKDEVYEHPTGVQHPSDGNGSSRLRVADLKFVFEELRRLVSQIGVRRNVVCEVWTRDEWKAEIWVQTDM